MTSKNTNRAIHIDEEALSSLALVQEGILSPITKLMGAKEATLVDETKAYKDIIFPFSFILAPKGAKNEKVLQAAQKNEILDLFCNKKRVGEITVDEVFEIDKKKRLESIFGTSDKTHLGVKQTLSRLGSMAISGEYTVEYPLVKDNINRIKAMKERLGAKFVSSMILSANPLNRAHERMMRNIIDSVDLLVIFLKKPFHSEDLSYEIRYNSLIKFIDTFMARNKVLVLPFENTDLFSDSNELISDALLAKNYGCDQLVIGANHSGLGLHYSGNEAETIFDRCKNIDIHIKIVKEYVYCNTCKTLVNDHTCPHGQHHHVKYHPSPIMQLIKNGMIPPAILVRKEVSASILASLFPDRFENLQELHYSLMPNSGLLETQNEEQFYMDLMDLYRTTSL